MRERPRPGQGSRALRLVIEYQGRELKVVARQQVQMSAPPSDPVRGYEGQSGFWFELRSRQGDVLYRRVVGNPVQFDVEVHDPETGSRRYVVDKPAGTFVVLVPDLPDADRVVLVSSPLEPEKRMAPAATIAEFPLGEQRRTR